MLPKDLKSSILRSIESLGLHPLFGRATRGTATIFMAHGFSADGERESLTPADLRRHFTFLRQGGYRVLSLDAYVDALLSGSARSLRRSVVFTIDDGGRDFYLHAFPVFQEFGFPATIFLTTDYIDQRLFLWWHRIEHALEQTDRRHFDLAALGLGQVTTGTARERAQLTTLVIERLKAVPNQVKLAFVDDFVRQAGVDESGQPSGRHEPLSWDEIRAMVPHGIHFHPHTRTHPVLSRIDRQQKLAEMVGSRQRIEDETGATADIFCYPNGRWVDIDAETLSCLREAGYRAAVTAIPGFDRAGPALHPYLLRRYSLPVEGADFAQYVSGLENLKERFRGRTPPPSWGPSGPDSTEKAG